jgi:hypothetical protein
MVSPGKELMGSLAEADAMIVTVTDDSQYES